MHKILWGENFNPHLQWREHYKYYGWAFYLFGQTKIFLIGHIGQPLPTWYFELCDVGILEVELFRMRCTCCRSNHHPVSLVWWPRPNLFAPCIIYYLFGSIAGVKPCVQDIPDRELQSKLNRMSQYYCTLCACIMMHFCTALRCKDRGGVYRSAVEWWVRLSLPKWPATTCPSYQIFRQT